jgi:putative two-component system response regulator
MTQTFIEPIIYTSIPALLSDLETHDELSFEHMMRVGDMAQEYARQANMQLEAGLILESAARLHDIGKLKIPTSILCKRYSLENEEFNLLKAHPGHGKNMLGLPGKLLNQVRSIINSHHERWDGLGYPNGLFGEGIPEAARIIHVIDAYDAMTEKRPYGTPKSPLDAERIIRAEAGTQFDPSVVSMFFDGF